RRGGGGDRDPRPEVGRASARGRRAQGGRDGDGGRAAGLPLAELRQVVAPRPLRVHRRDPEDERRQVPEDRPARAIRSGAGPGAGADGLKAALLRAVDGPFELVEVADPEPDGRSLVRVRAAGINFADVLIRRGRYPQMPDLPVVLGGEVAGELEDGTRVMALTSQNGGYPAVVAGDRASLVPVPGARAVAGGAAVVLTFLTAYIPLARQVRLRPGATVLVLAAAGGVGSAALQCARALGARPIAAVGSPEKLDLCRELGAEAAYVYDELPDDLRVEV